MKKPGEPENRRTKISANLADQLGGLINLAQGRGDTEMVSWLMERRHRLQTAAQKRPAEAAPGYRENPTCSRQSGNIQGAAASETKTPL